MERSRNPRLKEDHIGSLPPIFPDVVAELKEYIECPEKLPMHQIDNCQYYWKTAPNILSLAQYGLAPVGTTLQFNRDPVTGQIADMVETTIKGVGETAKNSMSMQRAPGPLTEDVRGNDSNIPFWPGGFDEPEILPNTVPTDIDFENNLRTLAKGFSCGIEFKKDNRTPKESTLAHIDSESKQLNVHEEESINLMDIVEKEGNMFGPWPSSMEVTGEKDESKTENTIGDTLKKPLVKTTIDVLDSDDLMDIPILKISKEPKEKTSTEWAEQIDVSVPVTDFHKKIPDPALKFEYELDTFQKQAILKLEEDCHVFVAAHTSAGKTTVAEYAIALSQKHMTRVIYTSPIKALSNQKYRDFKRKFESVGLLTGDIQINQSASCLVMTTEILQSMLYCASEVLRDLEFVIFDEVHYINNEDRGHVWEEIVILLPQNITIVMLSATVPNPLIFADWVGRIKKRKMYVISTLKRPVPLLHYLYIGIDGRTKDDKFLVLDANGQFILDGWYAANTKFTERNQKSKKKLFETQKGTQLSPKQEEVMWIAFMDHLRKNDLTPVVIFTLSRKRCDMNAAALKSLDFTTANEKHQVHVFFQKNIKHLKGTDKELPQILMMQELLQKGIGIHHSGILPILKEIVELLFQSGVVKLLFATETFAMGVNMPARTVVFDSIRKYDGNDFRTLHPTEYIQMAGRAGRRGHDKTGTVIVMCKKEVPHLTNLKLMMCGKAKNLESKFKVTYAMVLNLRRVNESVTVEAMMRRSFKESPLAAQKASFVTELERLNETISKLPPLTQLQEKLATFYDVAVEYLEELKSLKLHMLRSKKCVKSLTEGRVLIVSYAHHYKKLALVLKAPQQQSSCCECKVLVLTNANHQGTLPDKSKEDWKTEKWHDIISLITKDIFVPTGVSSHEVLTITATNIWEITNCVIKASYDLILKDWEKRQIARFKNDPPGPTCQTAAQELMSLSVYASLNPNVLLPYVKMVAKFDFHAQMNHVTKLRHTIDEMNCTDIANFEEHFKEVFERSELESKRRQLQLQLSDKGMALYPNYVNMVALLKRLGYIDHDERVALKGRVALQMGNNELLITELILKNTLTMLQPAEIAALLSAIIFQQRTDVKPELIPPELKNGCKIMEDIHGELTTLEQQYQLATLLPLNFGLVEVVYDWAQAKSFSDIMKKTDVQEGIIVRCIQQLNETLRDVRNAAVTIGDPVLKEKMDEASTAIKRDIVFSASLYTQD